MGDVFPENRFHVVLFRNSAWNWGHARTDISDQDLWTRGSRPSARPRPPSRALRSRPPPPRSWRFR